MVTMTRRLSREEQAALASGTQFVERFTLGLYAPEFSDKRSEVELELVFDKNSTFPSLASELGRYNSNLNGNPCPGSGVPSIGVPYPYSGSFALFGASFTAISALAAIAMIF